MFDRLFPLLYRFAHQQKKLVIGAVLAGTVAAGAGLFFVRYGSAIDLMLPPDPEITRSINFLHDSSLSDKIVISLALTDPAKSRKDLLFAADQLAASLTPPLFTRVVSGFSVGDAMEEFSVLRYAPQVLGEADLALIDCQINAEAISEKLRAIYRSSLRPESIFTSSFTRADPLGIKTLLFDRLKALPTSMGYDASIEDGHIISRDGRHTLLVAQTPVSMMDGRKSRELIESLEACLKSLPASVSADVISGHLHTVSNERVMKRDILVASTMASAAFLVLFLLVFRDPRVLFVFIIPLIAVVWAINIATGIAGQLSYLVIGFGTSIAGISIDYGLLVYIALKRGADAAQTVKLARLVGIDAITTIFSFAVLYFSMIRGYHQLALFSILCVFICLVFSLFVLPLVLSWKRFEPASDATIGDRLKAFRRQAKLSIGLWAALTLAALALSFSVRFDSDVKKLDGSEPAVLKAEQTFHDVWGGRSSQAIFVVSGKTYEEAMETNDAVYREALAVAGKENFTSMALFWPSPKQRKKNSDRWDRFWKQGREKRLKRLIRDASAQYGFSDRAFSPFFDGLYTHAADGGNPEGAIARMEERFVLKKEDGYRVLSFFPDDQKVVKAMTSVAQNHPGAFIVSGEAMSSSISAFTSKEMTILAPAAILFNVLLAWLFFKNWKEALISLVPVVTGVVWLAGVMALFKLPLNIVNVVAAIVTTGVIVDYGLGITYEYRYNLRTGTVVAVTLSAATNIIGTGVLLFAKHPALYSTGVAMVICMVTGYLSSIIVVPSLCSIMETANRKEAQG
ncbi:MAG TPA: hypothetical protein VF903_11535 [Nitrospirota bacterium]